MVSEKKRHALALNLLKTIGDIIPAGQGSQIFENILGFKANEKLCGLGGLLSALISCYQLYEWILIQYILFSKNNFIQHKLFKQSISIFIQIYQILNSSLFILTQYIEVFSNLLFNQIKSKLLLPKHYILVENNKKDRIHTEKNTDLSHRKNA